MPIVGNKFYNDPNIGAAFSSLAQAFAPPSAQDTYAYAGANAKRQEAARLSDFYARAQDPTTSRETLDRLGLGAGAWNPTQSFYRVDQDNASQRYGYDQSLAGTRYSADTSAATSRANNAADNARALSQTQLTNTKDITTSMLAPVAAGATRFVPPSLSDMFAVPQTQVGTINAGPGEQITTPDGRTIVGAPKPLTEGEVKGEERRRLTQGGLLTDQALIDAILGAETPVEAVDPAGRRTFMTPGAAVRTGAQPAPRAPTVSVNNAGEGSFDKRLGEKQADLFIDLAADGVAARNDRALLDRLADQTRDLPGGMLGGLQSLASGYGIKLGPNASNVEAADAIIARLVPAARQGMPGAASDRDVALFRSSLPSLSQTPEGRRIVSETLRGLAQARVEQARIATAVVNGTMTRPQGMMALQDLPNPFASLRDGSPNTATGASPASMVAPPSAPSAPSASSGAPVRVSSPADAMRLPSGTAILLPDGSIGRVP